MKKLFFKLTVFSVLLSSCNNGENTNPKIVTNTASAVSYFSGAFSNWNGVYEGTTFCIECGGVKTDIELRQDLTYKLQLKYFGGIKKPVFENTGSFSWNENGDIITLQGVETFPKKYLVTKNTLIQLDENENVVKSKHIDKYALKKQAKLVLN